MRNPLECNLFLAAYIYEIANSNEKQYDPWCATSINSTSCVSFAAIVQLMVTNNIIQHMHTDWYSYPYSEYEL